MWGELGKYLWSLITVELSEVKLTGSQDVFDFIHG